MSELEWEEQAEWAGQCQGVRMGGAGRVGGAVSGS